MARVPVMSVASEAQIVARELIHQHHNHLITANILYVFTDQKRKRCDRIRLGSSKKMSSTERFLASGLDGVMHGPDFLVMFDSNEWEALNKSQRSALVDHELCHCALFVKDDSERPAIWLRWTAELDDPQEYSEQRWGLRSHDVEEFGEVLFRHGFWKPDGPEQRFGEIVAMQLKMPENNSHAIPSSPNELQIAGSKRGRRVPAD